MKIPKNDKEIEELLYRTLHRSYKKRIAIGLFSLVIVSAIAFSFLSKTLTKQTFTESSQTVPIIN